MLTNGGTLGTVVVVLVLVVNGSVELVVDVELVEVLVVDVELVEVEVATVLSSITSALPPQNERSNRSIKYLFILK